MATTIAAFVSLGQYVRGLYKRGYWNFSKALLIKLAKIAVISLITGAFLYGQTRALLYYNPQILACSKFLLLIILGAVLGLGGLFYLILAKIFGIIDFAEIIKILKRRK